MRIKLWQLIRWVKENGKKFINHNQNCALLSIQTFIQGSGKSRKTLTINFIKLIEKCNLNQAHNNGLTVSDCLTKGFSNEKKTNFQKHDYHIDCQLLQFW